MNFYGEKKAGICKLASHEAQLKLQRLQPPKKTHFPFRNSLGALHPYNQNGVESVWITE